MEGLGKTLIFIGIVLVLFGVIFLLGGKIPLARPPARRYYD